MPVRVTDRLTQARRRRFVGRALESDAFLDAVTAGELPFQVLYVHGPGGVGKTTLLKQYLALCEQVQVPAVYLDARNVDPSPAGFVGALQMALGVTPPQSFFDLISSPPLRHVILVDTYEILTPLDAWLRDEFLPQLPENIMVVLAGRNPPASAWRSDPGWHDILRLLALRNLEPDESRALLTMHNIPPEQHKAVLEFTHGHPLALSLVADVYAQRPGIQFQPQDAPDVIKTLLEQFVQKVPGPAHRAALEACVLVNLLTESLLSQMLATSDAHDLFEWLRSLSFIENSAYGLFPHDLAREAQATDLRWRNPDWYAELHRRARSYYTDHLALARGLEQQRILFDLVFLHRDNPLVRPFFEFQETGLLAEPAHDADHSTILGMIKQHEGEASCQLAEYWLQRQPQGWAVFRDAERQIAGLLDCVVLEQTNRDDAERDPAVAVTVDYLAKHAPLRAGETALLFRYWMARETYQSVSPIQSTLFINIVRHYLTTPNLAFHFLPCAEPEFWAPAFGYADLARLREADFKVGGKAFGTYGHDWRVVPPGEWLSLLGEREIAAEPAAIKPAFGPAPLVVLSEPDFAAAVRSALHDLLNLDALRSNPLVQSRLIVQRLSGGASALDRATRLQSLIRETVETLQASPRDAKLYRALYHTYIKPAPSQESAAEVLDLPFSTFRRHLKAGIDRVTEILWHQEIGR